VTGATGFIGLELVRQLHASAVPVLATVGPRQNQLERQRLGQLLALGVPVFDLDLRRERPFAVVPATGTRSFILPPTSRPNGEDDVHINDHGTRRLSGQLPLAGRHVIY
jgi:nucleoside-diphosphate-sugar epimerase